VEQATHVLDLARYLVGEAVVLAGLGGRWPRADAPDSDIPDVSSALLQFQTADGPIPGLLSAASLLRGSQAIELQLVCEGRVVRLSERALVVETGQETHEVLTTIDPFLVEDQAFVDALGAADPARVLCSYAATADGLAASERALPLRGPLSGASDHASFLNAGVPAVFLYRIEDPNYHSAGDTATLVDPDALRQAGTIALKVLDGVAAE
jgi:predicted dehydrogenase